jgi:glycosyltransferase involved in cell wall biosynthesis
MSNEPLISIIIPCYNMGKYITEALESIGKQNYTHWEVIAVDDCGPEDGTKEIVESFAASHPEHRVEFIRHVENGGVSKARNTAIHAANGEFLAFLDPDDFWGATFLSEHMKVIESDGDISVSYTDARFVNDKGMVTGGVWGPDDKEHRGLPESLYRRNFINPSTVLSRTEKVILCGSFDESPEIQHVEDWDLWLRMLHEGAKFSYTPSAQSFHRRHAEAATSDRAAVRLRESALRDKYSELPTSYTLELISAMERRMKQLEGKQQAYEGSVFFRAGRLFSSVLGRLIKIVRH